VQGEDGEQRGVSFSRQLIIKTDGKGEENERYDKNSRFILFRTAPPGHCAMSGIKKQQEDICPECKAQLDLGEGIVEGNTFSRDAKCPRCDFEGEQVYNLVFSSIVAK
jgi:hypothetical protein